MPLTSALLDTVSTLLVVPPLIVNPVACAASVRPLMVLLVIDSVPDKVASVPDVGNVTFVEADVEVNVNLLPEVTKSPPNVMVLVPLFTPVPPCAEDNAVDKPVKEVIFEFAPAVA